MANTNNNMFQINGITSVAPVGSIMAYLGAVDPAGWVICDGITRTNIGSYNNLINMGIGISSGSNYTPPNYSGAFLRGTGTSNVSTVYSGPALNTSQSQATTDHSHYIDVKNANNTSVTANVLGLN